MDTSGLQQPVGEHHPARRRAYGHGYGAAGAAHRYETTLPGVAHADEEGKPEDAPRPRLHLLVPEQGRPRVA